MNSGIGAGVAPVPAVQPMSAPVLWALAIFALGAVGAFQYPLNHDVAWILAIGARVLSGQRLYVDVIELNPPLIVWLNLPVVAAAHALHIDPGTLFRLLVLAIAAAALVASMAIVRGVELTGAPFAAVASYVVVAGVGYDFGQREHLALLLSLPYLACAVRRMREEGHAKRWVVVGVAAAAGIGFALKPFFLAVPLLVELVIARRRRSCASISAVIIGAELTVYAAAVLVFAPAYVPLGRLLAPAYGVGYFNTVPLAFALMPNFLIGAIGLAFGWRVLRRHAELHVLFAAAVGFGAGAVAQWKGWGYHWLPFAALGMLVLGAAATEVLARRHPAAVRRIAGAVAILGGLTLFGAATAGRASNPYPAMLAPVIAELGGGPVGVLSSLDVAYPLVTLPGVGSSFRLPTVGLLVTAIRLGDARIGSFLRGVFAEDMRRAPPRLLIEDTRDLGLPAPLDLVGYLSQSPEFAVRMADFRLVRRVGPFRILQRQPS
jgi:hypothetical protein